MKHAPSAPIYKVLKHYWSLWLASIIFMLHQFIEPFVAISLVDSYLDDLSFFPVVYGLITLLFRLILTETFRLTPLLMASGFILSVFATEWLFPLLSAKHVGDPYDAVAYFLGIFIFHVTSNRIPKKPQEALSN